MFFLLVNNFAKKCCFFRFFCIYIQNLGKSIQRIIDQKYLHFQRKTKLSMVAIFFRKKTSIRKAHFQFSFMPTAKKWQITPILLFRFRCGIFYCLYFYNSFSQDSKYS